MKSLITLLTILILGVTTANASDYDFKFIDEYLEKWDRFANGNNSLISYLRENKERFENQLSAALRAHDKRAPARMVFYPVVQVGGYIPINSELGKAVTIYVGRSFPTIKRKDGSVVYFAGDLYFWWEKYKSQYESYPLFAQWSEQDFAKQTVIPMYSATAKSR